MRARLSGVIRDNIVPVLFLVICLFGFFASRLSVSYLLNELIARMVRNLVLVVSLVLPVLAGMGLNFAIVVGAMAGQVGLIVIRILRVGGMAGIIFASAVAIPVAVLLGYGVGKILNKTKGREMITSLILGYFAMGLYQLVFLLFMGTKNREILLPGGIGVRNALDLSLIQYSLDRVGQLVIAGVRVPVFSLLISGSICVLTHFLVHTKLGQDFRAVGQDVHVAEVVGIDVDRTRLIAMAISTATASLGQIIFLQNIGTLQTYSSHEQVGMFAIAAILVGGASVTKATVWEAVLGTILFHTLFIVSPAAGQNLFGDPQIGEFFRSFVAYGIIALSLALHAWRQHKAQAAKEA